MRDVWHGEQKPSMAGHKDEVYQKDVFFLIHKTGMQKLNCNSDVSNRIFIKSDLCSTWATILHPNESIMVTKTDHSRKQALKKALGKHHEASMKKMLMAVT